MIVPRDSAVGPVDLHVGPDDVRSMSPRRTSEDLETIGKAAREELQRSAARLPPACFETNIMETCQSTPGFSSNPLQSYRSS